MTTATKYKTYPKYKPSGADWLGDIPVGWEVKKAKFLSDFVSGYSFDSESYTDDGVPIIRIGDIAETIDFESVKKVPTELSIGLEKFNVKSGDILLALTGATIGKTAIYNSTEVALLNQRVAILRGKKLNQKYLTYFIASSIFKENIDYLCFGGAQENIGKSEIGSIIISYPTIEKQKEIVAYLDLEMAKIDKMVVKKQKMIELLKEKRQALITQAVTKGLDLKVKMKPSGIDWLGDIPEGWEVKKVKYLGRAIIGLTYSPDDVVNEDEGVLILRSSNIQNGLIELNDNVYVKKEIPEDLITKIGDILICSRNGSVQLIGKNILIDENTANLSFGAFMTIFRSKYYDFLYYFFNSSLFISQTGLFSTSTINQLTTSILNNMEIPLPPVETQKEIVKALKNKTANIDGMMKKVEMQIEKLQEYRQALITNAVTGKIMVN